MAEMITSSVWLLGVVMVTDSKKSGKLDVWCLYHGISALKTVFSYE